MTYRSLRKILQEMDEMRLDDEATVFSIADDDYHPIECTEIVDDRNDVLDEGHMVIVI